MTLIDPRLLQAARILRPDIPIPGIIETTDAPGPTRVREFESLGAYPSYSGRLVPQIHADVPQDAITTIQRSGAAKVLYYDEPTYAANVGNPVPASPLRSTPEQIQARIDERLRKTGPHPKPNPHYRSYFGAMGPTLIDMNSGLFTLDDVRAFTKSDKLFDAGATGKGILVAILDTGVDQSHPMLDGQVKAAQSFVSEPAGADGNGHGSWCASAIAGLPVEYHGHVHQLAGRTLQGMAPGARLLDMRVLSSEGSGATSGIIQGVEAAVEKGARILSLSLGSLFGGRGTGPDAQAIDAATKAGVAAVVASGNSFAHVTIGSPGSAPSAITVGSVAMKKPAPGIVSTFSSKGPLIDGKIKPSIVAPGGQLGRGIDETILGAASGVIETESGEPYSLLRGSSMATPVIAGILAQIAQGGLPTDRNQVEGMLARGTLSRVPVKNNREGWGVVDAMRLAAAAKSPTSIPLRGLVKATDARSRPVLGRLAAALSRVEPHSAPERQNLLRLALL